MTLEGAKKAVETRIGDSVSFSRCESYEDVEMYDAEYTEKDVLGLGLKMPTIRILIIKTVIGE